MSEDSHIIPLAPPTTYPKSDKELNLSRPTNFYNYKNKNKSSSKFFVYLLSAIVLLSIVMLIFSMIFFRFKAPSFELGLIDVKNLRYSSNSSLPSFNMTMGAEVIIDNDNFGRINFQDSSMSVFIYDNVTIGFVNINVGRVEARKSKRMGIVLQVGANELNHSHGNLSSDLNSRMVKLRSVGELRGKVKAMKIVSRYKTSVLNCTMNLNLTSQAIQDLLCS
ncbi:late embryogenesis abundant protein At1g64065-like [Nicotiana tabacum]|uniref:Late embryogenesis abundant protein At1g64065-like n=1 Tax=Nicotiana tabacum TaxID=4097 RepID=A0A1S4AQD6_TOBAC|nr:PREDICTED: late embryogenesis abundant protein At1g64065-like [Nicotiana tabacum]